MPIRSIVRMLWIQVRQRSKTVGKKQEKFKGHDWSQKGTKKQRAAARNSRKQQWFYAVAVGHRPGIYLSWPDATAQVHKYHGPVYKKFPTLKLVQEFMDQHRIAPPSVRTPFPPHPQTPLPQEEYVYSTANWSPTIVCAPRKVWPHQFTQIQRMAERIVQAPYNRVLDPPEYMDPHCPYSCGDMMSQRFSLMRRLYQLNSQLGCDPDSSSEDDIAG